MEEAALHGGTEIPPLLSKHQWATLKNMYRKQQPGLLKHLLTRQAEPWHIYVIEPQAKRLNRKQLTICN